MCCAVWCAVLVQCVVQCLVQSGGMEWVVMCCAVYCDGAVCNLLWWCGWQSAVMLSSAAVCCVVLLGGVWRCAACAALRRVAV